jgi:uncharacterized membrane protein
VLAGISVATLIPPMQSPDEHSHVTRADTLSRGHLMLETPAGESTGGRVDEGLIYFTQPWLNKIVSGQAKRLSPADKEAAYKLRWTHREHFLPIPGTNYYFPLAYAPHALGLAVGQALDLSIMHSYRLTRIFCIAAGAALLVAAFRVLRPPPLAVALLLLPMTVFQWVLPTLDGVTTSLAVLALSVFARRMMDGGPSPAGERWLLAGALFLLATTRVHLAPMLLLPLVLAWRQRAWRDAVPAFAAIAAALAWTVQALLTTVDARVVRAQTTGSMVKHYVQQPWEFARVFAASVTDGTLSTHYAKSFVGILGWLDTELASPWYLVLGGGLAVCLAVCALRAPWRLGADGRAALVATAVTSVLLIFFALLVTWTPHPAKTVDGVQGRYFIVPALAVAYAMARPPGEARPARWPAAVAAVFGALSLYALIAAVLARYH